MPHWDAEDLASVKAHRGGVPCPTPMVGPFGSPLTFCLCSQQMDDAVYTFETLLHQEVGKLQGKDDLCKSIQRILERVLKVRGGRSGASVAFGGLQWPYSTGQDPGEEDSSDLSNFNRSLLGKFVFILRFSCVLLACGAGEWETWRSQVPSDHMHHCKRPPGVQTGPQTLLPDSGGGAGSYPGSDTPGTGRREGVEGQRNLLMPVQMGWWGGNGGCAHGQGSCQPTAFSDPGLPSRSPCRNTTTTAAPCGRSSSGRPCCRSPSPSS